MKILVALGGNALLSPSGRQDFKGYQKTVRRTARSIARLVSKGHQIAITHGNGSQVGNLLLQQEEAGFPFPLDVLGAETQGQIGYLLQRELQNLLPKKEILTLVTQILVDSKDPAFGTPTKPVGPFYSMPPRKAGWTVSRVGRKWRRVVPSPRPLDIVEKKTITQTFDRKAIVIACGGGGIPVVRHGKRLEGVEAVIDKDLTAALLASLLKVELFLILTDVKGVYLNYGKKNQRFLKELKMSDARQYLKGGEFGEGSMWPKVKAAVDFLTKNPCSKATIASLDDIGKAVRGKAGTLVIK